MFNKSILVKEPFMNQLLLFPTAQTHVAKLVEYAKTDKRIKRLTIFGSALESRHNPWSDIDVFVEGLQNMEPFYFDVDTTRVIDIIRDDNEALAGSSLLKEIKKKGVVVYERDPT